MGGIFSSMKKRSMMGNWDNSITLPRNFTPPEYSENERVTFVPKSERVDYDNDKKFKFRVFMDFEDLSRLDNYEILPEIALRQILYYVTPPDLFNISLACRYFEKSTMSNFFWKNYFCRFFEVSDEREDIPDPKCNFKKHFYEHYEIYESERKRREKTFRIVILGDFLEDHSLMAKYFITNSRDAFKTFCTKDLRIHFPTDNIGSFGITLTAEVWKIDLHSQSRNRSLTRSLIKKADACIYYTNYSTCCLRRIERWREIFRSHKNFTIEEERKFPVSVIFEEVPPILFRRFRRLRGKYELSRSWSRSLAKEASYQLEVYCEENGFRFYELGGDEEQKDEFGIEDDIYDFESRYAVMDPIFHDRRRHGRSMRLNDSAETEMNDVLRDLLRRCVLQKENDRNEEEEDDVLFLSPENSIIYNMDDLNMPKEEVEKKNDEYYLSFF